MQPQNHFYQTLLHRHSQDESDIVEHCLLCFQNVHKQEDIFHYVKRSSFLCGACRKQLEPLCKSTKLDSLQLSMLYRYNDFLENMIFQFKEGRDIALRPVFFHEVMQELNDKFRQYAIVLMPSSKEKMLERGFLPRNANSCDIIRSIACQQGNKSIAILIHSPSANRDCC